MEELSFLGHPRVLLNTSFNLHGRSMVRTASDALKDFLDCDLILCCWEISLQKEKIILKIY